MAESLRKVLSMGEFPSRPIPTASVILLLAAMAGAASAQQTETPVKRPAASVTGPAPAASNDNELLAKAAKLYYSTREAGLDGFDCNVHLDWKSLFSSGNGGAAIAADDPRLSTLKPVRLTVHARMGGGSTMDWVQPPSADKPADAETANMLDAMHRATEQTLQGFLQFWIPFVDGSVVPATSEGLMITRTAGDWTIHSEQNGTEVTEIFSREMILQYFNVLTSGVSIKFAPKYQSTDKGLLVNRFEAHIERAGPNASPAQDMHVEVLYATVGGVPIPSNVKIEVVGTGNFNMTMDGCHTLRSSK